MWTKINKSTEMNVQKTPLNLNHYESYGINQAYKAFLVTINDIEMQQVEDLEYDYIQQRYKIFNSELIRQSNGLFTLKIVIAQATSAM
ncbi:MAG: hypothetical protein CME65_05045 [Halobacteriovoraceae bacterium]|nr:hypothetical protein [Halobacteriovoraceae bacterium]